MIPLIYPRKSYTHRLDSYLHSLHSVSDKTNTDTDTPDGGGGGVGVARAKLRFSSSLFL